jgi:hypothetical protein
LRNESRASDQFHGFDVLEGKRIGRPVAEEEPEFLEIAISGLTGIELQITSPIPRLGALRSRPKWSTLLLESLAAADREPMPCVFRKGLRRRASFSTTFHGFPWLSAIGGGELCKKMLFAGINVLAFRGSDL